MFRCKQKRIKLKENKLYDIDKRLTNMERKAYEVNNLNQKVYKKLDNIEKKIDIIATKTEQENVKEIEMERSSLIVCLKMLLQFGMIVATALGWYIGIIAYIKITLCHNILLSGVGVFVILGDSFLALYIIVKIVRDIIGDIGSLIREISSTNMREERKTDFPKWKEWIKKIETVFFLLHFVVQIGVMVYTLTRDDGSLILWLVGIIVYALFILTIEMRGQILKQGYMYIYNLSAMLIALISLTISLKPYLQKFFDQIF